MSDPQPPRFIQLPSPASLHIMESLICYENSRSQQHLFSSTPLSSRFSQTCICLQRYSPILFSLVETCFYHTCSWTQSNCMLSLFLFSLYEESLRLFISIKLYCNHSFTQSTIPLHTTQKWKYREYKHENATVKQKESGLLETIPIHGFK